MKTHDPLLAPHFCMEPVTPIVTYSNYSFIQRIKLEVYNGVPSDEVDCQRSFWST